MHSQNRWIASRSLCADFASDALQVNGGAGSVLLESSCDPLPGQQPYDALRFPVSLYGRHCPHLERRNDLDGAIVNVDRSSRRLFGSRVATISRLPAV